jgi:hypothetical protein
MGEIDKSSFRLQSTSKVETISLQAEKIFSTCASGVRKGSTGMNSVDGSRRCIWGQAKRIDIHSWMSVVDVIDSQTMLSCCQSANNITIMNTS